MIKVSNKSKTKNVNKPLSTGIKTIKRKNTTDYERSDSTTNNNSTSSNTNTTNTSTETVSTPDTGTSSNLYILGLIIFGGTTYYIVRNRKVEE